MGKELLDKKLIFEQLIGHLEDVLFVISPDWKIVHYISPSYETLWGHRCEYLLRNPLSWVESIHPEDKDKVVDYIKEKSMGDLEEVIFPDYRIVRPDGSTRWVSARCFPITNDKGEIYRISGIATDITERKLMEEKYRQLARHTSDYVHCCTRIGTAPFRMKWIDGAVNPISGYHVDEVLKLGCFIPLIHPDDQQTVNDYLLSLVPGDSKSIEFRIVTQQNEIRWVKEKSLCVEGQSEGEIVLLGAVTDITKRKNAEIRLKQSNQELDAFVKTVAHDLRTPIIPIIGYAEILREHYKEVLDEQGLSFLAEIEKSGETMLALMEDLLTLATTGNLQLPGKRVSTDNVVADVIKNLEAQISRAGVVIQTSPLPPVRLPKTLLTQIFDNLIGNAIRYAGKSRDPIEVGGEQVREKVRFFVRDHGSGIREQERKHIFEIFYRGTNTGEVKGSGMGLAIVYKLARSNGGRAWVEETPGGGCTFWVEIDDKSQPL